MFIKTLIVALVVFAALIAVQVKQNAHWSYNLALAAVSIAMLSLPFLILVKQGIAV